MKRYTTLNTFIGAIPGAVPPIIGWAGAAGEVGLGAYVLFLILFAWQHPHFYALAWLLREDYARGGLKMLTVTDKTGRRTVSYILVYCVLLLVVSVLPTYFKMTGSLYLVGVLILGTIFLFSGLKFGAVRSDANARLLFRTSLLYFPLLLGLILVDTI